MIAAGRIVEPSPVACHEVLVRLACSLLSLPLSLRSPLPRLPDPRQWCISALIPSRRLRTFLSSILTKSP